MRCGADDVHKGSISEKAKLKIIFDLLVTIPIIINIINMIDITIIIIVIIMIILFLFLLLISIVILTQQQ